MPGNRRLDKLSRAEDVSEPRETKPASREPENRPAIAGNRRSRVRRNGEATQPSEDAMDVALGSEDESWDRRRVNRRKNAD
jgi:hypothetical protein